MGLINSLAVPKRLIGLLASVIISNQNTLKTKALQQPRLHLWASLSDRPNSLSPQSLHLLTISNYQLSIIHYPLKRRSFKPLEINYQLSIIHY